MIRDGASQLSKYSVCVGWVGLSLAAAFPAESQTYAQTPDLGCWVERTADPSTQVVSAKTKKFKNTLPDGIHVNLPPEKVVLANLRLKPVLAPNFRFPAASSGPVPVAPIGAPQFSTAYSVQLSSTMVSNSLGSSPTLALLTTPSQHKTIIDLHSPVFENLRKLVVEDQKYELILDLPEEADGFLLGNGVGLVRKRGFNAFDDFDFNRPNFKLFEPFKVPPGLRPWNKSSIVMRELERCVPDTTIGACRPILNSTAPSRGGDAPTSNGQELADAIVQVVKISDGEVGRCVGSHIGDGIILTANHCLGTSKPGTRFIILFGDIEEVASLATSSTSQNPSAWNGEFGCSANVVQDGTIGINLNEFTDPVSPGKPDVGFLQTSPSFLTGTLGPEPEFREAKLVIKPKGELSTAAQSLNGPRYFATAMIWPEANEREIATSINGERIAPRKNQKVLFQPSFGGIKSYNCEGKSDRSDMPVCATENAKLLDRSRRGWAMTCPSRKGASGAPVFETSPTDPDSRIIIGVMSAEAAIEANCASPVWYDMNNQ